MLAVGGVRGVGGSPPSGSHPPVYNSSNIPLETLRHCGGALFTGRIPTSTKTKGLASQGILGMFDVTFGNRVKRSKSSTVFLQTSVELIFSMCQLIRTYITAVYNLCKTNRPIWILSFILIYFILLLDTFGQIHQFIN